MGLDLVGFSSRVLPTSAGYAADRRHARGGAAASHGFFAWRSHPRTTLKDSVVCSTEDGGGGGAESTLCVSGPSENASRATGGVAADLGRGIADGITASQTSSMGRKKGGRLWRRPSGGDKPARAPRRAPVREDPQVRRVLVNNPDVNAILSGVSRDSSIAECNSVLIRLEKHSDVKALDFFVWMKANGKLERNADAYRLALQAIAWKEDWRRAELLLHEMVAVSGCRLDAGAFNGLIYVCAKRRLADWGTKWFHMMLERKVQPNVSTVGMLMGLYQKTGNLKEAEFAFVKTRECNVKCVNAYSAMITLYTRSRLFDKSEEVITLMKHDGVVPNMENWLVQLNAYSQQGKMEEAELVLQSMEDGGVSPNVVAYNTVITGYGKVSDMQKAKEVFDRLGSSGLAPDETTYRSMIEGFGRADKHKEAISYYKKLKSSGFQPNASNFYTMINLIARHDDSESAAEILRDMRAAGCQCSSIVTILVRAYRTVGRMHKVLPILQSCFYKKVLYDATSCSILVTLSFSQSYRPKAARPATSFYGESLRANTARTSFPAGRQSKAASRAALTTRCAIGDSLEEFLTKATPDKNLIRLLICMGEAMRTIAFKVRTASCGGTACVNSFGDEQLAVDMLADKLLFEALEYSHVCKYACSEEVPELQDMGGPVEGGFSVAFDPLDGSSIVDTNFTVGTIFGVWPGDKLTGVTGGDQVAAAMGIYGPRTTFVVALKDCPGTHEFLLLDEGKWQHVKDTTSIGEGKMFSPGNLRATFDNPDYDKLVNYYVKEKYTLRYTGGMVPDVNQIIVKEKGIFTNVTSPTAKAKLRLLFEVAPLGFLIEKAGGHSSDGKQSVLDKVITVLDERTQVAYGSKNEIIRFEETLYGSSRLAASATVGATA